AFLRGHCRCLCFFFFQAEDGIRDRNVTGVQTCALPIYAFAVAGLDYASMGAMSSGPTGDYRYWQGARPDDLASMLPTPAARRLRSEERRVGKECRSRGSPYHVKKEGKLRSREQHSDGQV